MKTRFILVFFLLLALNFVLFAKPAELDIRMYDNSNFIVVIDNYPFDDGRQAYHIRNLSHGHHHIEVYRLIYNGYNPHAPAVSKLFFSGRIFLQGGYLTYAEVNRYGRLSIIRKTLLNSGYGYGNPYCHGNNGHVSGNFGHGGSGYAYGMNPASFSELKHSISRTSFDSNKLELAKFAASRNRMTSGQVSEITRLFTFESNRLDFAKFAYSFVVDPGSYFVVANAFTFSSSKRELFDYIGYGSGY
jgi:hypothetical protein